MGVSILRTILDEYYAWKIREEILKSFYNSITHPIKIWNIILYSKLVFVLCGRGKKHHSVVRSSFHLLIKT